LETCEINILKEYVVPGYVRDQYHCFRVESIATDLINIPITILCHRNFDPRFGATPILLHAYGAYGSSIELSFDFRRTSLLDRGIAFAVAHIRGGGEMGDAWYNQGKLLNKENTFSDFATCAKYLIESNMTKPQILAISGRSAGGLLVGVMANRFPSLFSAIIADVPFVDVM